MKRKNHYAKFVVCVKNKDYQASLELRKIYQALPDAKAASHDLVRIVDESGEDYLYPASYFLPLALPREIERVLRRAS